MMSFGEQANCWSKFCSFHMSSTFNLLAWVLNWSLVILNKMHTAVGGMLDIPPEHTWDEVCALVLVLSIFMLFSFYTKVCRNLLQLSNF